MIDDVLEPIEGIDVLPALSRDGGGVVLEFAAGAWWTGGEDADSLHIRGLTAKEACAFARHLTLAAEMSEKQP